MADPKDTQIHLMVMADTKNPLLLRQVAFHMVRTALLFRKQNERTAIPHLQRIAANDPLSSLSKTLLQELELVPRLHAFEAVKSWQGILDSVLANESTPLYQTLALEYIFYLIEFHLLDRRTVPNLRSQLTQLIRITTGEANRWAVRCRSTLEMTKVEEN